MQNIDVRFNASSNFSKVRGDLAALEAQAASLNAIFAKNAYAKAPALVDSASWGQANAAVNRASKVYRDAASSSGILTTQQIRATSEAERYTKALQKQQLSIGDMTKHRGIMREVYNDQLRYQRMSAQYWGTDMSGRAVTDIAIPKNVPQDLNTMGQRMGMFSAMTKSAGTQIVNLGKNIQWSGRQLTVGFTYPMVLFGAAAGVAAYKTEAAFAKINKVYDVSARAVNNATLREKELGDLRVRSMEMATQSAKLYGSSLSSTLQVEQELAATGLKGKTLLTSTQQVQRISALGDIDPAQTTKMIISLKTAFRDSIPDGKALTDTLNFMNAAANATSLNLQDIAEATPRAASGLAALGVDAKQMTIMLVAMREAGVESAQGANALKSATARILNPTIVKKATKMFTGFGANIDVGGLAAQAKGNFYDFIQLLGQAENKEGKLTAMQKNSANAALFGTMQFSRLTAVLKNMWDAQNGVNNQTKAAMDLQGKSSAQLASIAENSRKAMLLNPAGRFKIEWESLKIELSKVGDSFLGIATSAETAILKILKAFNGISPTSKHLALLLVGLLALAGPLVMLTGLTLNLWGQFTKGIGNATGLMARFMGFQGIVNKEEQAAALSTEAQNKALQSQTLMISELAREVEVLTAAYQQAATAAEAMLVSGAPAPAVAGAIAKPIAGTKYVPTPQESTMMATISTQDSSGRFTSEQTRLAQARNKMAYEYMAVNNLVARDATKTQQATAATARTTETMKKNITGASLAGTAMSVSMAAMLLPVGQAGHEFGKWLMIGTLVVPAVKGIAAWTLVAATRAKEYAAAQLLAGREATATMMANIETKGVIGGLANGMKGFGAAAYAALGPVGLITLGAVAVTGGILAWKHHLDEVAKEQTRIYDSVDGLTKKWADGLGLVAKKYHELKVAQQDTLTGGAGGTDNLVSQYSSGAMKKTTKDFAGLNEGDQNRFAAQHYMELQIRYGQTADEARKHVVALYEAAGYSAEKANTAAKGFLDTMGNLSNQNGLEAYFNKQIDIFQHTAPDTKQYASAAKDVADTFKNAFANADPIQSKTLIDQFVKIADAGWATSYNDLVKQWGNLPQFFTKLGVSSGESLRAAVDKAGGIDAFINQKGLGGLPVEELAALRKALLDATNQSSLFFGNVAKGSDQLGASLDDSMATATQFTSVWQIASKTISFTDGIKQVKALKAQLDLSNMIPGWGAIQANQIKTTVNQMNLNNGFAEGATAVDAINNYLNRTTQDAYDAAQAAKGIGQAIKQIPTRVSIMIDTKNFVNVAKTAMSAVQDEMVSSADSSFDAKWQNRINAATAANTAAENGAKARHKAALDRIQAQIDAEKKADDVRAAIFEAEKTRLQQLADMQNKNIDFNTAINQGNLDEAAKIQNDMVATSAANQMDAEEKRAKAASDAKVATLEAQSKKLEAIQQKQEAGAQAAHQKQIDNMNKERDYQKAMLDQRLALFKAYTGKNQKDLERWMKVVGLSYDDFGKDVKAKGESWSTFFQTSLAAHIREAAMQVKNDAMWSQIGADMATSLLSGLGFPSMAAFNKFVNTGALPKGYGVETHHTGGIVGSGSGSRGDVSSSYRGLHPSEQLVRAQKGERILDKNTSRKYAPVLDAIHRGVFDPGVMGGLGESNGGGPSAGFAPITGLISGALTNLFKSGLNVALQNTITQKMASANAPYAGSLSGAAGKYNGRAFNAQQMQNAATIAGVGSKMGMSTRDIEIGIMTAITESGLNNLPGGDRDSAGLFQQRPSQGWGSLAQVTDPVYAATKFFNSLSGVSNRNKMPPWLAAQAVQRSAFADGSNYHKWWSNAIEIFTKGLQTNAGATAPGLDGAGVGGGFIAGKGGKHRPISVAPSSGIHDVSTGYPALDFSASVGHPVYAVGDGRITRSYDLRGYEPRRASYGKGQDGYMSYGRVIYLKTNAGPEVLYAHLSRRSAAAGQAVRGGSILGYSGDTGNSTGPHLHFGSSGASPYAWLKKGGEIRWDNTPAILHRGETVLTAPLTKKFQDNVASGGGDHYTIQIDLRGAFIKENVDIEKAVNTAIAKTNAKVGLKRKVQ